MAIQEQRRDISLPAANPQAGLLARLAQARPVLLVAAIIFIVLQQFGGLGIVPAIIGFAVIALSVLVRAAVVPGVDETLNFGRSARPGIADRWVEAVISALPEPAIALTTDSLVVAFNGTVQQIAPGILSGEPLSFALRVPDVLEAIRTVAARREVCRTEFFQRVPTDRWWEATITPLVMPGETAKEDRRLVLLTFRDLTPLRRVEEIRADFVANASHELRTPLASLSGFIETLQGPARNDAPSRDRFLAIMKVQATRMARLIDDLLSLSRIEQKAHIHPDSPIDLVAIARQVVDGLSPLAHDREVELGITAPKSPLVVPGDRDEMLRVFENLIENALKYGAPGKRVDITLACDPADRGCARCRCVGARLWPRYRSRASAASHRTVLPGRYQREPRPRGNRSWPCAGQAYSRPPSRASDDRKHARRRRQFQFPAAAGAKTKDSRNSSIDQLDVCVIYLSSS